MMTARDKVTNEANDWTGSVLGILCFRDSSKGNQRPGFN